MRINDTGLQESLEELRGLAATSSNAQRTYLEVALAIICLGLEVPFGKLLELDQSGKSLRVRAALGWRQGIAGQTKVSASSNTIAGYAIEQRDAVVFDDVTDTSRFSEAHLLRAHGVRATLAVPIACNGVTWGVLSVHEQVRRAFSSEEVQFVKESAGELGRLIEVKKEPPAVTVG